VVARGCEASVFAVGHVSRSEAWLRGGLPLAIDERIKVLLRVHDRCAVVTAKVIKHHATSRHVVMIAFERTRGEQEKLATPRAHRPTAEPAPASLGHDAR
jgi:hypothetical protein